jgi:hypothetical protein
MLTTTVKLALYGFVPLAQLLFLFTSARRAMIAIYILGWMFLPDTGIVIDKLPDLTKTSAPSFAAILGVILFDSPRLIRFRPRWYDLPMLLWCLHPFASSILNGLGPWDGTSAVIEGLVLWGVPYFIGRLYFNDAASLRELVIGLFLGGVIYMPLCWFEMRMSPQLHQWVYGWIPDSWSMYRFGGWRPIVFMHNGLMLGMWMACATIAGLLLAYSRSVRHLFGVHSWIVFAVLLVTTIWCRSLGALLLLMVAMGMLATVRLLPLKAILLAAAMVVPSYMLLRGSRMVSGQTVVAVVREFVDADRARSLNVRFENEERLAAKAMEQPWFGWGRWGRSRVFDHHGRDISLTDGYWIIVLGQSGLTGLGLYSLSMLLPILLFARRFPAKFWFHPALAPAMAAATCLLIYQMDNLMNAMLNPVYAVMAGGLIAVAPAARPAVNAAGTMTSRRALRPHQPASLPRRPAALPPRRSPAV